MQQTVDHKVLKPVVVKASEGEARWWFSSLAIVKASAADTGGQLTIIEVTEPPGAEAPLHVHHREDEAFWILEGEATFEIGDVVVEAGAGDYLFGPRDIPHRFTVGPNGCRMLFICTPGGFENLVTGIEQGVHRHHDQLGNTVANKNVIERYALDIFLLGA